MSVSAFLLLFTLICYLLFVNGLDAHEIEQKEDKLKLVIDQDAGADDAMAIYLALLHEKFFDGPEIVAITTTNGNVNEPKAFNNTQRILGIAERQDIPIYRGSNKSLIITYPTDEYFGVDGLGENDYGANYESIRPEAEHAAIGLIELSKKYEGKLIVLSLGSLTNIALAIRLDPLFISRLAHLYVAAGHIHSPEYPDPEFNALADVEAYYATVASGHPEKLTLIAYSQTPLTSKTWRTETLGSLETTLIDAMNEFESVSLTKGSDWSSLDPMAMAIVLDKTIVKELIYTKNSIGLWNSDRGICINEFVSKDEANARIVYSISEEAYKRFLLESFSQQFP